MHTSFGNGSQLIYIYLPTTIIFFLKYASGFILFNLHDSLPPSLVSCGIFLNCCIGVASLVNLFYEYWAKRSDVFGMG